MPDPRKVDAVFIPQSRFQISETARAKLGAELGRSLGERLFFRLDGHTGCKFASVPDGQSRLHPYGHPDAQKPRYEWHVADRTPDGKWSALLPALGTDDEANEILFGFLLPDPHAEDPEAAAAIEASMNTRKDEARAKGLAAFEAAAKAKAGEEASPDAS